MKEVNTISVDQTEFCERMFIITAIREAEIILGDFEDENCCRVAGQVLGWPDDVVHGKKISVVYEKMKPARQTKIGRPKKSINIDEYDNIVALALKCKNTRVIATKSLKEVNSYMLLSIALNNSGYHKLSLAVINGVRWAERIAQGQSLASLESEASFNHWSWNQEPENQ